ncbi:MULTISPECIES: hypothetical protein [unclassified Herbaspirillum]|uniref:hypothetical protein n=1 Tax=unclassified Herbaspirillum TaxID=2624150 RepID=UPI001150EB85|nr:MULTISPECIES: hypothetical protein [unclassified Herbaspirillum]MBB5390872.1 hypothetical protein [Herbaspirillum sp. SJZ102]
MFHIDRMNSVAPTQEKSLRIPTSNLKKESRLHNASEKAQEVAMLIAIDFYNAARGDNSHSRMAQPLGVSEALLANGVREKPSSRITWSNVL